jgi:hypothetical protein
MGKELSTDEKNKKSWDSNAITPGTPFMHLLATSLRYWTAQKLNSDPGWKNVSFQFATRDISLTIVDCRSKFISLMPASLGKESTKLWTSSDGSDRIQAMIPILDM